MADDRMKNKAEGDKPKTGFPKTKKKKSTGGTPKSEKQPVSETKDVKSQSKQTPQPKDVFREVVETVVFVVVLVLLLKTFVAEAFIIPTGSMAPTLLGFNLPAKCPACEYPFTVNRSSEVEKNPERRAPVTSYICPNCRLRIESGRRWNNQR